MQDIDDTKAGTSGADDFRRAFEEARARVAADPGSEDAAEALFAFVEQSRERLESAPSQPAIPAEVRAAAALLAQGQDEQAEIMLRRFLSVAKDDPSAMILMANIAARHGLPDNAEKILRRATEVNPGSAASWVALAKFIHRRAMALDKRGMVDEALACLERALEITEADESALAYKAAVLVQLRRLDEGEKAYVALLDAHPGSSPAWVNFAYLLRTIGRFGEAVAACRTAAALDPYNGPAWWGLADLKRAPFFARDLDRMERAIHGATSDIDRINLHFAAAAACDRLKLFDRAVDHLERGSEARMKLAPYDRPAVERGIDEAIQTFTPDFFIARSGAGDASPAPIFIVGMPRSGSTLVEQILSSHPDVEATEELQAVQQIEAELFREFPGKTIEEIIRDIDPDRFETLGRRYLELSLHHRRTDRPRFADKNPGNWRQIGFIHTMLPNAKIIDVRRNPLDCCVANYFQHYNYGVSFSYGLREVGAHYGEYLRLMRHFDVAVPGLVHRIIHDDLVDDLEGQVRRLLDYLDLPFDDRCLKFFETDRPVHTPSSEQVRQPVNRSGVGKWKNYDPWIGELKDALGDAINDWRR